MQALNRLEWLIKTNKRYSGDRFFVMPFDGKDAVSYKERSMYDLVKRSDSLNKKLLEIICFGDYLYADDIIIDDKSRLYYYRLLMPMYIREFERKKKLRMRGIEKAKEQNVYKGRGQIKIDPLLFDRVANDYLHGKISADQASLITPHLRWKQRTQTERVMFSTVPLALLWYAEWIITVRLYFQALYRL